MFMTGVLCTVCGAQVYFLYCGRLILNHRGYMKPIFYILFFTLWTRKGYLLLPSRNMTEMMLDRRKSSHAGNNPNQPLFLVILHIKHTYFCNFFLLLYTTCDNETVWDLYDFRNLMHIDRHWNPWQRQWNVAHSQTLLRQWMQNNLAKSYKTANLHAVYSLMDISRHPGSHCESYLKIRDMYLRTPELSSEVK